MDVAYYPYTEPDGIISGVMVSSHDITENKLAEDNFRDIFEYAPIGILTLDTNGNPENINKRGLKILGSSSIEQTKKINVLEFENLQKAGFSKDFKRCLATKKTVRGESLYTSYWNKKLFIRYMLTPIFDKKNTIKEIQCLIEDFTERKQVEEELQKSEKNLRTIFENMQDVIYYLDAHGKILTASPSAVNLYKCDSLDEIIGKHANDFVYNVEDNEKLTEELQRKGFIKNYIIQHKRQNGEPVFVETNTTLIVDEQGHLEGAIGVFRDITDRKQAEEQVAASLKEKEVLLREIHHRTKNNMQVMISLLKIQSANIEDKQVAGMFKESRDRIKSMALVHEKLYQSKGLADVDFKGYVKSLVNSIFSSYGASVSGITSITETDDVSIGLETAIPCGLIINELVSNSLKYAFPGNRKGEIRVALRSFDEDALVLEVGDNGIGMPEDLDFRNTASMGLHLVNILSEDQLHGKIELDRAGGTTFRIRFKNHKYEARI